MAYSVASASLGNDGLRRFSPFPPRDCLSFWTEEVAVFSLKSCSPPHPAASRAILKDERDLLGGSFRIEMDRTLSFSLLSGLFSLFFSRARPPVFSLQVRAPFCGTFRTQGRSAPPFSGSRARLFPHLKTGQYPPKENLRFLLRARECGAAELLFPFSDVSSTFLPSSPV